MNIENLTDKFKFVKAFAFDVDGVFTDGNVFLLSEGEFIRTANIKDGYAVQYCIKQGYPVAIITGGKSKAIMKRFTNLGVRDIYLCSANKYLDYEDFLSKHNLDQKNVLYMGDDIPDYKIMKKVGVPTCPLDAAEEIKQISLYISGKKGGEGCVRDIIEQVLKSQGKWLNDNAYLW